MKAAASAAQARVTVALDASQRAAQRAAGLPERKVGAGVAAQVGLARRDSPVRGARHLGLARALVGELPHTLAALSAGETSEWRATLIARETACLTRADRARVDAELAARPGGIGALGDREAAAEARRIGYRLDPHALTDRAARAHSERRVTLRPAPDTMACLSGLLPAVQGVAVYAALTRHADTLRSDGDARSRGQIMADTLVERVTGQTTATAVPVEVHLVMTDTTLLGTGTDHTGTACTGISRPADRPAGRVDVPAQLEGYGPLPAPVGAGLAPRHRRARCGCVGSTPAPRPGSWSRWTPDAAGSPDSSAGSWSCATSTAAPPGATPRSDTSTTPDPHTPADPPAPRTPKASARPATTPRKPPAGPPPPQHHPQHHPHRR